MPKSKCSQEKEVEVLGEDVPGDELQRAAISVAVPEAFFQSFFSLLTFPPHILNLLFQLSPLSVPLLLVFAQCIHLLQSSPQTCT